MFPFGKNSCPVGGSGDGSSWDSNGWIRARQPTGKAPLSPISGKTTAWRVEDTRELGLPALPFIGLYRIIVDTAENANRVQGAQR